jgi:AraC-like DNA-binding protein
MKKGESPIRTVQSISELHRLLHLPKPAHPLVSIIQLDQLDASAQTASGQVLYPFYQVCMKKNYAGGLRYGQNRYDFDEGILSFIGPGQLLSAETAASEGWVLLIHPDFLQGYPLAKTIRQYGFFAYELTEALFVSDKEEQVIDGLLANIEAEYHANMDRHSQDIIITQLDLLLHYANRFYSRQFLSRKPANTDLLTRLETVLSAYFNDEQGLANGLPTVEYVAGQLNVSAHYLSDMLRSLTGQSAQQHIQQRLIEQAKTMLSTTTLSVGDIAYQLGFTYPQSFNKLFKSKTSLSPIQFRQSFN